MSNPISIYIKKGSIAKMMIIFFTMLTLLLPATATRAENGTGEELLVAQDSRGVLYVASTEAGSIDCLWQDGSKTAFVQGFEAITDIAVDRKRTIYVGTATGQVWAVTPNAQKHLIASGMPDGFALAIDRDQRLLAVIKQHNTFTMKTLGNISHGGF